MERKIFSTQIGGREVTVETGAYCGQKDFFHSDRRQRSDRRNGRVLRTG